MENHNSTEETLQQAAQEDPIVMYLIVRESLGMSIGKVGVQCGHAVQLLMLKREEILSKLDFIGSVHSESIMQKYFAQMCLFNTWLNSGYRKVTLRASEKDWIKLKEIFTENERIIVVDLGLTELAPMTETIIGLLPMRKSERPKLLTKLQTLK